MLDEILQKIGLSDKEIIIYKILLQYGKAKASALSRLTKINRTTIYSVTKELVKKGLITEDLGDVTGTYVALPPTELDQLIKQQERDLTEKKSLVDNAVLELQKLSASTSYSIPKISFIEEDRISDFLYSRSPVWHDSITKHDKVWWGIQDTTFVKQYENWIDWYWEWEATHAIPTEVRIVSNAGAESIKRKKFTRRQIRFSKLGKDFSATIWVTGEYLIMIITSQSPNYLVEIHDVMLSQNMRELFKNIWDNAK